MDLRGWEGKAAGRAGMGLSSAFLQARNALLIRFIPNARCHLTLFVK